MKSKLPLQITEDEIRAIYAEGEEAVMTLVKSLVERISGLEARGEALVKWPQKTGQVVKL